MSRRSSRSTSAAVAVATEEDAPMTPSSKAAATVLKKRARSVKKEPTDERKEPESGDEADEKEATKSSRGNKRRHVKTAPADDSPHAAAAVAPSSPPDTVVGRKVEADGDEPMKSDPDEDGERDDGEENAEEIAASLGLSLYEYQRQQNIKLKNEQLQMLNLAGLSGELGLKTRPPVARAKSKPRVKKEPAVGIRRSLRSSAADPNYVAPPPLYVPEVPAGTYDRPRKEGVLTHEDALPSGGKTADLDDEEKKMYDTVFETFKSALLIDDKRDDKTATELTEEALVNSYRKSGCIVSSKLKMLGDPTNAKIIKSRATAIKVHPTISLATKYTIVAASDKNGHVSVARYENDVTSDRWSTSIQFAEYAPHVNSVVDLHWSNLDSHLLYTASRDGSVRKLDIEARVWDEVFVEDEEHGASVSGIGQAVDQQLLIVGDRDGYVHWVDPRADAKKQSAKRSRVGTKAINGCVVSPLDSNLLVTGGLDRAVRAWDRRKIVEDKPLAEWVHTQAINSVAFSPSGKMLCSTSHDDTLKVWSSASASGAAIDAASWTAPRIVKHNNNTGRWVTRFRAYFAPAEAALAIGSMQRSIDVWPLAAGAAPASAAASSKRRSKASAAAAAAGDDEDDQDTTPLPPPTLGSELRLYNSDWCTTIPAVVAWHPTRVQIVGCTGSGRLYVYGQPV